MLPPSRRLLRGCTYEISTCDPENPSENKGSSDSPGEDTVFRLAPGCVALTTTVVWFAVEIGEHGIYTFHELHSLFSRHLTRSSACDFNQSTETLRILYLLT